MKVFMALLTTVFALGSFSLAFEKKTPSAATHCEFQAQKNAYKKSMNHESVIKKSNAAY
jgi:hypothetical protein